MIGRKPGVEGSNTDPFLFQKRKVPATPKEKFGSKLPDFDWVRIPLCPPFTYLN